MGAREELVGDVHFGGFCGGRHVGILSSLLELFVLINRYSTWDDDFYR